MKIKLFTDGACSGNPGPGGAAFVMLTDISSEANVSAAGGYRLTTNNRMEIASVIKAMEYAKTYIDSLPKHFQEENVVTVLTDSQMIVGTMNNGWEKKKNLDLWKALNAVTDALRENGVKVNFLKVQAHHNVKHNEEADRLASVACKNPTLIDYVYEKTKENENV